MSLTAEEKGSAPGGRDLANTTTGEALDVAATSKTTSGGLQIIPLESQPFGAEVLGLDLKQELSEDAIGMIKEGLHRHLVGEQLSCLLWLARLIDG